jgi:hypothetical protein
VCFVRMEGIAATASIIAFVESAAKIMLKLKDYYKAVRDARGDVQRLYPSISTLQTTLNSIEKNLRGREPLFLAELLRGPLGPLLVIREDLEN